MMKKLVIVLFGALPFVAQPAIRLADVRKIYIEKMSNDLDEYLRAAISKKFHQRISIVLDRSQADAILTSPHAGAQQTERATVDLMDPRNQVVLWSGSAGDRSATWLELRHGGEQKVADHLIGELKKAMEH
ncbi:MAG: hypothetical protein JO061_18175 [Acidobacteriaceae bacterium]|nr:hypothetical protein [Acidobacteriaceae bacterium]